MSERDPRALTLAYLRQHQVMTLATHGPEGLWAAAVFYVHAGFQLYFLSAAHTRHARNLAASRRVAATIQEDYKDWQHIQGIQLEGVVRQIEGLERETAVTAYQNKYPFVAQADSQIQAALTLVNWYCLQPDRLYFIDNSQGLGHRDEIVMFPGKQ